MNYIVGQLVIRQLYSPNPICSLCNDQGAIMYNYTKELNLNLVKLSNVHKTIVYSP